jgi:hypothetical protein
MAARKAFLLRIDPELWTELERWAAAELRSVNGQIEFVLREAVRHHRGGSAPKPGTEAAPLPAPRDPEDS